MRPALCCVCACCCPVLVVLELLLLSSSVLLVPLSHCCSHQDVLREVCSHAMFLCSHHCFTSLCSIACVHLVF